MASKLEVKSQKNNKLLHNATLMDVTAEPRLKMWIGKI